MSVRNKIANPLKTVLTICIGFSVIYLFTENRYFLFIAVGFGLLALLSGFMAKQIDEFWMLLTKLLSYIVPNIILSSVFFLILFPIALMSKLFGKKDPLQLKKNGKTTFIEEEKKFDKTSFEQTF